MISFNHELSFKDINMREAKSESKTSVAFVMPIGRRPLEMHAGSGSEIYAQTSVASSVIPNQTTIWRNYANLSQ